MRKIVGIAAGGDSAEESISLLSAQTVYDNLDKNKFEPIIVKMKQGIWEAQLNGQQYPIDKNDFSFLFEEGKIKFDFIFIAIHGTPGEDGKLQAYFDLLGIPYSSPNHIGSTLTFNKWYCNTLLNQLGYQVAQSFYLRRNEKIKEEEILAKVGIPCFVKPCSCGSSYGISKVKDAENLFGAITMAFEYDVEIMIEEALDGVELTCGVYRENGEVKPLPITQIIPKGEFFDFEAKYEGNSSEITPARIDENNYNTIQKIAAEVYERLDLRGICRVDFMLVENTPYIIEVNAVPGLSPESLIPQQVEAAKIPLRDFFTTIIHETIDN